MPDRHQAAALTGVVLLCFGLAGCGSVSSFLAGGMGDLIPAWAGGLPANAPPRPGTPEYDAMMKQREEKMVVKPAPDPATSPSAQAIR